MELTLYEQSWNIELLILLRSACQLYLFGLMSHPLVDGINIYLPLTSDR
ncbi:hypothetical protein [Nostoc sp. T09]|nr:hypothetical protein [Nostoc sp. T09]